ncbi:unnamed protein product [Danaus chrysippus]|uniref:(African queen) hypothetical protein n=1 Tax=Danaus chrysippus TaxID=151541 RepID=A0A8J2MVP7_9NEOP|nr:unnamed protein product [Danaus chrysippus]
MAGVRREHVHEAARLKPASLLSGAVVSSSTIDRLTAGSGDRGGWPRLDRHGYIDMGIDSASAQPDCCFLQPAPVAQRRFYPCHSARGPRLEGLRVGGRRWGGVFRGAQAPSGWSEATRAPLAAAHARPRTAPAPTAPLAMCYQ